MTEPVAVIRRFNRSYTQRVGVLTDSFLGVGLTLAAARLVFEIGVQASTTRDLRDRLGLDSGYLSRLLRGLEARGLVVVSPYPGDRRVKLVELTRAGVKLWQRLDERSDAQARLLTDPLSPRQCERLTAALDTADRLVRAATIRIDQVHPDSVIAREVTARYFAELDRRFEDGFDPGDASIEDAKSLRAPHGCFLVAVSDGRTVACGGVRRLSNDAAEIKRMWVDEDWRGLGLGSRMLNTLEVRARELGHSIVRLDTNATLTEAIALYERVGYRAIGRYNDNPHAQRWFEKSLGSTS
jgi:DNA-binding MarR family transcriptional regulator/ribosomal protein S18 acetylase RimI-like enzyme